MIVNIIINNIINNVNILHFAGESVRQDPSEARALRQSDHWEEDLHPEFLPHAELRRVLLGQGQDPGTWIQVS